MIIGVTGLPGVGKSTVSKLIVRFFEGGRATGDKEEVLLIDADEIALRLYEPGGACWEKIRTFLGEEYLKKGKVDKSKLRKTIFLNDKKLKIVNKLLHPSIWAEMRHIIENNKDKKLIVVDASYLEGISGFLDVVVEVRAPRDEAIERSLKKKITPEMYEVIETVNVLVAKADHVIENMSTLNSLENEVQNFLKSIKIRL